VYGIIRDCEFVAIQIRLSVLDDLKITLNTLRLNKVSIL
jgi:hypothetical protein